MTYQEVVDYLFKQLPMYQRVGKAAYKADLESTVRLMSQLENPERSFKCIHVGGTNGKGSVSHLLASIFQEAGYKTGLYTSPHLLDFRERIKINGEMISENEVIDFVQMHQAKFESLQLSFFEWTVGLAFHQFRAQKVDIAIIEVGMGGRLDSTNVIVPDLSIITNIGNDHSDFLGDTLAKIAQEKAGIIKAKTPVIIGKSQRETEGVFRKTALANDANITFADQQFPRDMPSCPLKGSYQAENFQTVLLACEILKDLNWNIAQEHIDKGFDHVIENTGLRGRWEQVQSNPKVICDVGHNAEGISFVVEQLEREKTGTLHLILGFVSDKDVKSVLKLFPAEAQFYLTQPSIPRAMHIDQLGKIADELNLTFQTFETVNSAYDSALKATAENDTLFIGGSTFVVADFLSTQ